MSTLETGPPAKAERHLAAILASDVVGYSHRMEQDEVGTLGRLRDIRHNLIEPKVVEHRGRVFKTMGDGFLAEFVSVLEAVHCAVDIQRLIAARNLDLPEDNRLLLRMGINLGDVFHEGDDVFGDGVNIAARLESIAPPGGIYISRAACDSIRDRLAFAFEDLGEHQVKNITRPIHVFGVRIDDTVEGDANVAPANVPSPRRRADGRKFIGVISALAAAAVGLIVVWAYLSNSLSRHQTSATLQTLPQSAPAPQPVLSPESKGPAQNAVDSELVFWQSISSSNNVGDFEEYLAKYPDGRFAGLARNRVATLRTPPPTTETEETLTDDQRRDAQRALRVLGHYQGEADGGFGAGTQSAIKQFQSFSGDPGTGTLTEAERKTLLDMARRLAVLFDQPATSPQGVAAATIKSVLDRYARAYNFENGKGVKTDPAEAAYWYALAAADGDSKASINLGRLLVRGWGTTQPNPGGAALLWWVAAARGEASAMFNEGVLYERGMGVTADLTRAREWYERAAAFNDLRARDALKNLLAAVPVRAETLDPFEASTPPAPTPHPAPRGPTHQSIDDPYVAKPTPTAPPAAVPGTPSPATRCFTFQGKQFCE
jgi:class 3 adenylate cyclase